MSSLGIGTMCMFAKVFVRMNIKLGIVIEKRMEMRELHSSGGATHVRLAF